MLDQRVPRYLQLPCVFITVLCGSSTDMADKVSELRQ
jgi:hypothetical protein